MYVYIYIYVYELSTPGVIKWKAKFQHYVQELLAFDAYNRYQKLLPIHSINIFYCIICIIILLLNRAITYYIMKTYKKILKLNKDKNNMYLMELTYLAASHMCIIRNRFYRKSLFTHWI